ncbi:MAG TPA: energy transducer TonB [Pyrinomonadaceae bacterium]
MHFRRLHLALAVFALATFAVSALAQKPVEVWAEWETISPENEEFTVLMPKNPTTESTKFPFHKMELSARLYLASSSAGPVLAITSLSGIKSDPAQYTEFARFNSYIDAFKTFFPAKIRSKDALTKLTLVSSRPFHGYTGRSYKLTIGDLSGSLHAFVTKKRFYAVISLNTKKDDALEEKFLSSFVLPDRPMDTPKTTASGDQGAGTEGQEASNQPKNNAAQSADETPLPDTSANNNNNSETPGNTVQPNPAPSPQQPQRRPPIAGGMLNGKAIYLPMPEIPPGEANGVVLVAIVIDEQGSVIEARAISGPQNLHAAAVTAARLARFTPTLMMGEPVRVSGTLSYNFVRSN